MYKLAVVGSREWKNREMIEDLLNEVKNDIEIIISGGARGADTFAVDWAKKNGVPFEEKKANWRPDGPEGRFDKGAGFKRNIEIVKACDRLLCFWDKISKGTQNSVDHAIRLKKPYVVITE